jgi:hypothetical protein
MRRVVRRLLGLDEPQETRFFLFVAAWAIGAGTVYWFVSYEPAGTVLLLGLGIASGIVTTRLALTRTSAEVRRRVEGDRAVPARPGDGSRLVEAGSGTGGIDRPFDDPRGLIPDPSIAPLAVGFGAAIVATGAVFGVAPVVVGLLPLTWGALSWLGSARDELDTTVWLEEVDAAAEGNGPERAS